MLVVGLALLGFLATAGYVVYESRHPRGWKLTSAERADIVRGGWKEAIQPVDTIPVAPEAAAEEVAARLAGEYCSERETERVEKNTTDHDYVKYIPGCFEVDEPDDRLEQHSALLEVAVQGGPPILLFEWKAERCMVNAGDQYEDHGICIHNLLGRALKESSVDY